MKAILAALLFGGFTLLHAQSPVPTGVHKIYVAELHFPANPELDQFVRSKLMSSLVQDCAGSCTVLEENLDGDADGTLAGAMMIQTPDFRHYRVQGAMRLVDRDGTVLWAATVYSSPFARSATSSFADNLARKLAAFLTRQ